MVDKIIAYEDAANSKSWEKDVLLVADNKDEDWETVFEAMNNEAAALLPDGMHSPFEGYLRVYQENGWNLNAELVGAINDGALMVNYTGHGSNNAWSSSGFSSGRHRSRLASPSHSVGTRFPPTLMYEAPRSSPLPSSLTRTSRLHRLYGSPAR